MVTIKTEEEIKIIAEGGKILATVIKELEKMAKPGITTLELDRAGEALILSMGAKPAFKGYDGFPYSLCASVNENIVHGFPSKYVLKDGDLLKLDLGVLYKGFNTDMAITVAVGNKVSYEVKRLINVTKKSLRLGIKKTKVGNTVGDIGNTIQRFVEDQGFGVVRDLCGHGIGKKLHEEPKIPNYGKRGGGEPLAEGMVICIEPMINMGKKEIIQENDGWTIRTRDHKPSAHFELAIAIRKGEPDVLSTFKFIEG
jgi:methionyl aminopeptidase